MEVLIGKELIYGPFSIAMFDYLRVNFIENGHLYWIYPSKMIDFPELRLFTREYYPLYHRGSTIHELLGK